METDAKKDAALGFVCRYLYSVGKKGDILDVVGKATENRPVWPSKPKAGRPKGSKNKKK